MPTYNQVVEQLKSIPHANIVRTKKEVKHLPSILSEDEVIYGCVSGIQGGNNMLLVCTQKRIIMLDAGFFYGVKHSNISLEKINTIGCEKGILMGNITIWDGAHKQEITYVDKSVVQAFVDVVHKQIDNIKQKTNEPTINATAVNYSTADELLKLANLKNAGVITEEEFLAQKMKLLG